MYAIKENGIKKMNLKVITNLAKLCELCVSEEEFYMNNYSEDVYKFVNGKLMLILKNGELYNSYFVFNDLINRDIKVVKDND